MSNFNGVEIAIIGMAGQFPGAADVNQLWANLCNGVESVSFFTDEELVAEGAHEEDIRSPAFVKANAYLDDKEYFDADFFGYLPAEAALMDPQLRVFHENCWRVLESAGYGVLNKDNNKIGLFAGATSNHNWENYAILANMSNLVEDYTASQLRDITFLCSRVSYLLDLQGPSVFVNTACSTSLVAVQRACMSLLMRECNMAIAGGICINNYSKRGYMYREGMISSPDGHCRTFDREAAGTVSGEGVGVVLLKRLADAMKDGDTVLAVIRGSAVNNDGRQKMSFTAPGVEGQYKAIIKAMQMAKIPVESISYVEAHGTATRLGDPIEVEALNRAFGVGGSNKYCALGSVKSNIGHLDAAAGIAGLIKTVLSLRHRQLAPSLHYVSANPKIDFGGGPFYVNTELREWKHGGYPLRAGVSSFGIGGTNAHVIVEEAPVVAEGVAAGAAAGGRETRLLVVSGRTAGALERNMRALVEYLGSEEGRGQSLDDIAYTLQIGRTHFGYRRAVVCRDAGEAVAGLEAALAAGASSVAGTSVAGASFVAGAGAVAGAVASSGGVAGAGALAGARRPTVVFMYPGQGSQYIGMCRGLYESEEVFRREADRCFDWVRERTGEDLRALIFEGEESELEQTKYTQPGLFIVEYALSRLLLSWGIRPDRTIGHSLGEYVSACIGGLFGLEDALELVVERGRLMQQAPAGAMASVDLDEGSLREVLAGYPEVTIAAVNSTSLCVVSGLRGAVETFCREQGAAGRRVKLLRTSHGFHCGLMEGILEEFGRVVGRIKTGAITIPWISNVTGRLVEAAEVSGAKYWMEHLRQAVLFGAGMGGLLEEPGEVLLVEVGPGRTLGTLVRNHAGWRQEGHRVVRLVRGVSEEKGDAELLFKGVGELWAGGAGVDWPVLYGGERRRRVPLPTYSFERTAYPVLVDAFKMIGELVSKGREPGDWYYVPSWRRRVLPAGGSGRCAGRTLILSDGLGIGERLTAELREQGEEVICTQEEEVAYGQLGAVSRIVHAWGIQGESLSREASCDLYFYSLTRLVGAAEGQGGLAGKEIVVVTSDLYPIVGGESGSPYKALSQGMLKVLSQENPTLVTSHIDITLKEEINIGQLAAELGVQEKGKVVGYRNGRRWVQGYERLSTGGEEPGGRRGGIREGGLYVVTGGLGKLGYELSRYLLERYQAKVVLLGRTLDSEKARRLQELERLGEVMYLECDIADVERLRWSIGEVEGRWGGIHGVIHAAGITSGRSIGELVPVQELTVEDFALQFGPKIEGLEALKEVLGDRELDFCLLTSSLSAILGGLGFGAYASANSYMDAYIQGHRDRGQLSNWVSVNLDGLNFREREVDGGSLNNRELRAVVEEVLLQTGQPQVIVSKGDLQRRLRDWVNGPQGGASEEPGVQDGPEGMGGAEGFVGTATERRLHRVWQEFFGRELLGLDDDFFEIGGDSLKALTLIGRIYRALNVQVSVTEFFKRPSIRLLAEFVDARSLAGNGKSVGIPKAAEKAFYHLSAPQQRLYFLYAFDPTSIAYNMPQIVKLEGVVDRPRLEEAFAGLVRRHESLRTVFVLENGTPFQQVKEDADFRVAFMDLCVNGTVPGEEEIDTQLQQFVRPFGLDEAPLIRVGLIRIGADEHLLVVDMHHIISDGISSGVLIRDFMSLYNQKELPALLVQYRDYAEWERSEARQQEINRQKDFWLQQFATLPPVLQLPEDHVRPLVKQSEGDVLRFYIGADETQALKQLAKNEGVTMFMLTFSLYTILIARLSNQEDIVIGTPTAGRPHADLEKIIGMFVNTLPLRNTLSGSLSFRDLLARIKRNTLACFDNQLYPYESLINELKIERDTSRNPLFDIMFAYHNFASEVLEIPGLTLSSYGKGYSIAKFDCMLNVMEAGDQLFLSFEYSTALFKKETIQRFAGYFRNIIAGVIRDSGIPIGRIELLSSEEQLELLQLGEGGKLAYPADKTLATLFTGQALRTPGHIALLFNERRITYQELNTGADILAAYLQQRGVGRGTIVGLMVDRSPEMILGILGILKAGATYLPLDGSHPEGRNRLILENSSASLLLTEHDNLHRYGDVLETVDIHATAEHASGVGVRGGGRLCKPSAEDAAYIIYTSGTTGVPKGVAVSHRAVVNLITSQSNRFGINEDERILQFSTISFDASVEQLWLALLNGAALVLIDNATISDQAAFKTYVTRLGVTHLHATPSFLEIMDAGPYPSLKRVIAGGEECRGRLAARFGGDYTFYNEYGPTETTVTSIEYRVGTTAASDAVLPIGRPIDNTRVYILDKELGLAAPGVKGELYIAGAGVAIGYLGDAAGGKFLPDPFHLRERMYRTGDLAKWLPDGSLAFCGRIDGQVKIRGYRIELGEIEHRLVAHDSISEGVVLVKELAGEKQLVAWYVSAEELPATALKTFLSHRLPAYMVPACFVRVAVMPLTPTGKIDRKALPEPVLAVAEGYAAPTNEVEEQLVKIWSEVLGTDKIGIHSNFFDLGGHSLSIMKMNKMINDHFHCNISLGTIFRLPNINALADFIVNGDAKIKQLEAGLDEREDALGLISELIN